MFCTTIAAFHCSLFYVVFLGTIRRFLEHFGEGIELVVFVTDGQEVSLVLKVSSFV